MEQILFAAPASRLLAQADQGRPRHAPSADTGAFPLRLAREGERVRITALAGSPGSHDRLAGLGLRPGAELQVLCNPLDGTLVVRLEGTRLVLGGGMAQKIHVVISKGSQP